MTSYQVLSVNVARPSVLLPWPSGDIISAIDKKPVTTPSLCLGPLNLEGDQQADTRTIRGGGQVHGGPDQAVYAYPSEHFPQLTKIIGRSIAAGFMGENVTLSGATEEDACIGDVWEWGSALLQITAPRGPCYKLGIRIGRQAARTVVGTEGLVGWYLRVLTPGEVPVQGLFELPSATQRASPSLTFIAPSKIGTPSTPTSRPLTS